MTIQLTGVLEIDSERGVIYFHTDSIQEKHITDGVTALRICKLPTPIPVGKQIDITWGVGISYVQQIDCSHIDGMPTPFSREELQVTKTVAELYAEINMWKDAFREGCDMEVKALARAEAAEKDRDRAIEALTKIGKAILEYEIG